MRDDDFYANAEAGLPAGIYPNMLKYCVHYPVVPIFFIISQITALYFLMMVPRPHIPVLISPIVLVIIYYRHLYNHSFKGDLNPGKVVSIKPLRLAVTADLSMDGREYKVLKIIPSNIKYCNGRRLKIGDRIPTAALYYYPNEREKRWGDFDPKPVQCFTFSRFKVEYAKNRIGKQYWDELDEAIDSMPVEIQPPGLYKID
jgi:hypothetical protein